MSWKTPRSPIHGLGMWLVAKAWIEGAAIWYLYGQFPAEASVIGRPKTPPCGTETTGAVFPRENLSEECVPRRVSTQPRRSSGRCGA